jgi:hypothetical protein
MNKMNEAFEALIAKKRGRDNLKENREQRQREVMDEWVSQSRGEKDVSEETKRTTLTLPKKSDKKSSDAE